MYDEEPKQKDKYERLKEYDRSIILPSAFCEPDDKVMERIVKCEAECVEALRANKADFAVREKLNAFRRFVNMLVTDGWIAKDAPIKKAIDGQKAPPKPKAPNLRDL